MLHVDGGRLIRQHARVSHRDATRAWSERTGLVLELRSGAIAFGVGEASPLPGYSRDDLTTCREQLDGCWQRLAAIDVGAPILHTLREAIASSGVRAPAAVFALETAVLDLVSRARELPAWAVLRGDHAATSIPVSAIADGVTPDDVADAAQRAHTRGIRVVKIKVGGASGIESDCARLAAVRARLGEAVALRLDANQTLPVAGLAEALAALAVHSPELLEEPTRPDHVLEVRSTPIPFAMDESLALEDWRERIVAASERGTHAAVVLKPMALGGFDRCLAIAEAAHRAGLALIVTHVFDGAIGTTAAACLALALRGRVLACGLDAHGRFERPPVGVDAASIVPFAEPGLGTPPPAAAAA